MNQKRVTPVVPNAHPTKQTVTPDVNLGKKVLDSLMSRSIARGIETLFCLIVDVSERKTREGKEKNRLFQD
jgi:hypothetical protein